MNFEANRKFKKAKFNLKFGGRDDGHEKSENVFMCLVQPKLRFKNVKKRIFLNVPLPLIY